jgi:Dyp-type peroxidase family
MEKVEWKDVQGLVQSGFAYLPYSAYILWHFKPNDNARPRHKEWLGNLAHRLIRADDDSGLAHSGAINLALTASGLKKLGVEDDELAKFSAEFREGMAPKPEKGSIVPRRLNILGDIGEDSPEAWEWGGWKVNPQEMIDGVMLLYACHETSLRELIDAETRFMHGAAIQDLTILYGRFEGNRSEGFREHFGFKDGISQPIIEGTADALSLTQKERRISVVKPGEFVLGYDNERGAKVTFSYSTAQGTWDLARNGTYLVFRQLEQDVETFNNFLSRTAALLHGCPEQKDPKKRTEEMELVAARLVGRKVNGEPLIRRGENSPGPEDMRNDFLYDSEDHFGLACPIGAHIRRANPRDTLGENPETALRLSKMHRIIRRGRIYGDKNSGACGLHFICLNADIAGQFEMIQHTWLNAASFNGLYEETDPLSHYRLPDNKSCITFQHRPTNQRIQIPKFVTVRGGGYFFLPGINALQSLAQ